jgi:hypothetical protein
MGRLMPALRWAAVLLWGCAWSLPWLQGNSAMCFAIGWTPAWGLALGVLLSSQNGRKPD